MTGRGVSSQWRCRRPLQIAFHTFADGVVVYDESNGSLHALNPIAGEALAHLVQNTEMSDEALARAMLQGEPEPSDLKQVGDLMGSLVSLGFVENATT